MLSIQVPDEYPYVLAVAASTTLVNMFLSSNVMSHRKSSGVKYPTLYASEEQAAKDPAVYKYNCAQRAHGNFLEAQPSFIISVLISGLRWPVVSAAVGAGWLVGRVVYAIGYTKSGPQGRMAGGLLSSVCGYGMYIAGVVAAVKFILN